MKTKNLLALLAVGCLFSCQQNEELSTSQKGDAIDFVMNVNSETRALGDFATGKSSFNTGDVLSLGTSDQFFQYAIGRNAYSWSNFGVRKARFFAHFPELASYQLTDKRVVVGGKEYLFGSSEEMNGAQKVNLSFKRVSIPVILLNENGKPYTGNAKVTLHVKNQGVQDLASGTIAVDPSKKLDALDVKKVNEGEVTNIIPQTIEENALFLTITVDGESYDVTIPSELQLTPDVAKGITIRLPKTTRAMAKHNFRVTTINQDVFKWYNAGIEDGCIPLRH